MILSVILFIFTGINCSNVRSFAKITIENKLNVPIRVVLRPAVSWTYHEQRTNMTLSRNPFNTNGGTHIMSV